MEQTRREFTKSVMAVVAGAPLASVCGTQEEVSKKSTYGDKVFLKSGGKGTYLRFFRLTGDNTLVLPDKDVDLCGYDLHGQEDGPGWATVSFKHSGSPDSTIATSRLFNNYSIIERCCPGYGINIQGHLIIQRTSGDKEIHGNVLFRRR